MELATLLALGASLSYAFSHFLARLGLPDTTPTAGVAVNVGIAAAALWVLAVLFSPIRPIIAYSVWPFVLASFFAPGLARLLYFEGIKRLGLARSSVLNGTVPLFSVAIAIAFLGERPSIYVGLGTISIVAGIVALNYSRASGQQWKTWAILLPLGSALFFALRDTFSKVGVSQVPAPVAGAAVTATTSALLFYCWLPFVKGERLQLTPKGFWLFAGAGLLQAAAYVCAFFALQTGMLSRISPLISINPLFSVALSYFFLQSVERVTVKVLIGGLVIVLGTVSIALF